MFAIVANKIILHYEVGEGDLQSSRWNCGLQPGTLSNARIVGSTLEVVRSSNKSE